MTTTTTTTVTLADLTRMLRESAGEEEGIDLDGDVLDTPFLELGYDSLALLQVIGEIQRTYGISVPDDAIVDAETPRALLEAHQLRPGHRGLSRPAGRPDFRIPRRGGGRPLRPARRCPSLPPLVPPLPLVPSGPGPTGRGSRPTRRYPCR